MATVPHELIAAIVDELEDDRESLKACSMVATAFCPPSQRHLFRSMWLHRANWQFYTVAQQAPHRGTSIPSGTIRRVSSLLSESPHLAIYVRDLTIDLPDSADEDVPLEQILQAVLNLERFVISGLFVRWGDLPLPLASAILDIFARPALERLHLLNMQGVPAPAVLRVLSFVRVLSIDHTTFAEEDEGSSESAWPLSAPRLHHLILSTSIPPTYALMLSPRAPRLTHLKKVLLRVDISARPHAERLLSSIADTLEELELDCGDLSSPLHLPNLPNLRSLTLRIFRGLARHLPNGFAQTLSALPRIAALTLIFAIQTRLVEGM
ncbi:hypothetical protein B0H17DRAFT_1214387 [Mycena rosella]|uniref:Uncharacterized protein n=1 Tax=Mycena rosella TaxID=1033263 RepID=A0AAD7CQK1_MYCRO|nr:hypothetical protein B0H17DRAFT_1214387 [Mycena rosella]